MMRLTNLAARILEGSFTLSHSAEGSLCCGPQIGIIKLISRDVAAAFLAHFWPVWGPGWGPGWGQGYRVRVVGLGGGLGLRPCVHPSRKCFLLANANSPPPQKTRAASLLGEVLEEVGRSIPLCGKKKEKKRKKMFLLQEHETFRADEPSPMTCYCCRHTTKSYTKGGAAQK